MVNMQKFKHANFLYIKKAKKKKTKLEGKRKAMIT